jgi:hypothetical protein
MASCSRLSSAFSSALLERSAKNDAKIAVEDEDGNILPAVTQTIMSVITAAFWSGLTTGHHAIAGGWGGGSR